MGLRRTVKRLEKIVGGNRESFELHDGTRFFFDPDEVLPQMFAYFAASARAVHRGEERPYAPPIIYAIARARDRESAYLRVFPQSPAGSSMNFFDQDALLARGEVVPRPIVPSEPIA